MADIKTPEERSRNMSRIRSKDTKPEEYIRKLLYRSGYRYRKNEKRITGHPDLWLGKYNTAIFVNGCYWHRHQNCKYAYVPKSNVAFWREKFIKNLERDKFVKQCLKEQGIRMIIIWECTAKKMSKSQSEELSVQRKIMDFLCSEKEYMEI